MAATIQNPVEFTFEGDPQIGEALDELVVYGAEPSTLGRRLCDDYRFAAGSGVDLDAVNVAVHFRSGEGVTDKMIWTITKPPTDTQDAPEVIARHDLSLPRVLGREAWDTYLAYVFGDATLQIGLLSGERYERERAAIHTILADTLQAALKERGLAAVSGGDSGTERKIISLFTEYRDLAYNPENLSAVLR